MTKYLFLIFLLDKGHKAENLQKECVLLLYLLLPLPYGGLQWIIKWNKQASWNFSPHTSEIS